MWIPAGALLALLVGVGVLAPAGVKAEGGAVSCTRHTYDDTDNKEISTTWTTTSAGSTCTWAIDPFQLEHKGKLRGPEDESFSSSSSSGDTVNNNDDNDSVDVFFELVGARLQPHTRLSIYGDYTIDYGLEEINKITPSNPLAELGGPLSCLPPPPPPLPLRRRRVFTPST